MNWMGVRLQYKKFIWFSVFKRKNWKYLNAALCDDSTVIRKKYKMKSLVRSCYYYSRNYRAPWETISAMTEKLSLSEI